MRGRNAALYSRHLFSGFMTCRVCGGAIVIVTGGYGSPRYGCLRSWRNGADFCANRVTVRAKVADACLLQALKQELLAPPTIRYVTDALTSALNRQINDQPRLLAEARSAREQVTQRLQRLVDAIEHGVDPSTVATAIRERQADVERLDATIVDLSEPLHQRLAVMPAWVRQQLEDLAGVLAETPERAKREFQRLGLQVQMAPQKLENGRPYYQATVESSLPCLSGMADLRGNDFSTVDRLDPRAAP
jgi:hypothetical protein